MTLSDFERRDTTVKFIFFFSRISLLPLVSFDLERSQKIRPAADPLTGGAGRPKFNQLEMVTTFTYRPSLVKIDARNFELSW